MTLTGMKAFKARNREVVVAWGMNIIVGTPTAAVWIHATPFDVRFCRCPYSTSLSPLVSADPECNDLPETMFQFALRHPSKPFTTFGTKAAPLTESLQWIPSVRHFEDADISLFSLWENIRFQRPIFPLFHPTHCRFLLLARYCFMPVVVLICDDSTYCDNDSSCCNDSP